MTVHRFTEMIPRGDESRKRRSDLSRRIERCMDVPHDIRFRLQRFIGGVDRFEHVLRFRGPTTDEILDDVHRQHRVTHVVREFRVRCLERLPLGCGAGGRERQKENQDECSHALK